MKSVIIGLSLLFMVGQAFADARIVLNGKSIHLRSNSYYTGTYKETKPFNETNFGLGFEYQLSDHKSYKRYISVGYLNDSYNKLAYHGGVVFARRWQPSESIYVELGANAMLISKDEIRGGKVTPFALPVLTVGTKLIGVNMTYVPKSPRSVSDLATDVLFFQVKLGW